MNITIIIFGVVFICVGILTYRWMLKAAKYIRQHGKNINILEKEISRLKDNLYTTQTRLEVIVKRLCEIVEGLDKRYNEDKQIKQAKKDLKELAKTSRFEDIIIEDD